MNSASLLSLSWQEKLAARDASAQRRSLRTPLAIDFCSNDYLGFSRLSNPSNEQTLANGATGSRLLSGQQPQISVLEQRLALFHDAPAALIFNSGYDANLGVMAAISDRHTVFIYDEYCHASLIDGMRLSLSRHAYKFRHNDMAHLVELLSQHADKPIALVCESVYSMDGDIAPLEQIVALAQQYKACVVVDEAHAIGVMGGKGEGLVQSLNLHHQVDVRIYTYGKAMGCHGAAVLGSTTLIDTLINFSRPFIYSTALPPAGYKAIGHAYDLLETQSSPRLQLNEVIQGFTQTRLKYDWSQLNVRWLESQTPIQGLVIGDVLRTRQVSQNLYALQLDVRPIFSPTVPLGTERLRICLHAFNSQDEIKLLIDTLYKALHA